ncbi:hypothetical protein GCM10023172_00040 [Hymenobacter ginsengisoli]|uniref:HTH cro/C1-type domain-containing protein n=1 Tax=Hymenobacter ginsengisoli TaxID=1051626 RepID=A0ABP8PTL2_9BACT|nr:MULTISPECIES: hypothetical protein [unclassified Hymenobacter]MBO2033730.1 hypothetical protein [Hymenobacter sp. BT559]
MEEEKRGPEVAPLSFPDLSLALPYQEALRYAQSRLKMIARGGLLPFCEAHKFPYTTIINLKNGNLKKEEPRLLNRLLRSLNVPNELLQFPPDNPSQQFLLPDGEALATFQRQLAYFTASSPVPGEHQKVWGKPVLG